MRQERGDQDNAVIGESSVVVASAVVKAGVEIPARSLAYGMPDAVPPIEMKKRGS